MPRLQTEPPPPDPITLALEGLTVPQMRAIADAFGWPLRGLRRDDLIAQMAAHYTDEAMTARALATLGADERKVLTLAAWGGTATVEQMVRVAGALLENLPRGWLTRPITAATIHDLLQRGYLLSYAYLGNPAVGVPPRFAAALLPIPDLLPAPPRRTRLDPDPMPGLDPVGLVLLAWQVTRAHGPFALESPFPREGVFVPRDVGQWPVYEADRNVTYWNNPARQVTIVPAGPPFPAALRGALREALPVPPSRGAARSDPDDVAHFFAALLLTTGLVSAEGRQWRADGAALGRFLALTAVEQVALLLDGWRQMAYGVWDELSWLVRSRPRLRVQRRVNVWTLQPMSFSEMLSHVRGRIYATTRWLPPRGGAADAGWVDFAALSRLLGTVFPHAIVPPIRTGAWLLTDDRERSLDPESPAGWAEGAEPLVTLMLRGPMRWLGLVETASDASGTLRALRLSPLGAAVVGGEPLPTTPATIVWGDDLTAEVRPSSAAGPLLARLLESAEVAGIREGRLCFRFTPDAAQASFEAGRLPPDIHAAFAALGQPLPAPVAAALDRWWQRWGLVHEYTSLAVIEVADDFLVKELLAATRIGQYVVSRCGPTALAVEATDVDAVITELRRAGYLPKVMEH